MSFPRLQRVHELIRRHVHLDGRDGDVAVVQRAHVGAVVGNAGGEFAADPVVGPPARIEARDEFVFVDALAGARDLHAFDVALRHVDVEQHIARQAVLKNDRGEVAAKLAACS